MGHAMDAAWYAAVLSACHLDLDLQQLPEGDMTLLADRGSNMSGNKTRPQPMLHPLLRCDTWTLLISRGHTLQAPTLDIFKRAL